MRNMAGLGVRDLWGECDQQYPPDIDDCHSNFGDDPADAEDLAN
jgi:hypothetical protein